MVAKVLERPTLVLEPQLAAGERGHGGPGTGAVVERVGPRGRSGRLPDSTPGPTGRSCAPRDGDPFIQAMRLRLRVPEVIALTDYDRLPSAAVTFSRRNMFKRDHWTCQYCGAQPGSDELTIDHVVPRSQGGTSTWENCVLACVTCNKRKADRTPQQAGMKLRQAAGPSDVEAAVRRPHGADRKLVEVRQRSVLEREVGGVDC